MSACVHRPCTVLAMRPSHRSTCTTRATSSCTRGKSQSVPCRYTGTRPASATTRDISTVSPASAQTTRSGGRKDEMSEHLGLHQAAIRCGVSEETIRRRIKSGRLPRAVQNGPNGGWAIPIADLVSAGLSPQRSGLRVSNAAASGPCIEDRAELIEVRARVKVLESERLSQQLVIDAKDHLITSLERHLADLRATPATPTPDTEVPA